MLYLKHPDMLPSGQEQCSAHCHHPELVGQVKATMPATLPQERLALLFKVLGDHTRIRILNALFHSELCVCDLTAVLDMNQSAVSHQLRVLRDANIVRSRKQGKNVLYRLDDAHVHELIRLGLEHVLEER